MTDQERASRALEQMMSATAFITVGRFDQAIRVLSDIIRTLTKPEVVDGWEVQRSSCHFSLKRDDVSVTISKYGGTCTVYRPEKPGSHTRYGVHRFEVPVSAPDEEMMRLAVKATEEWLAAH